MAPVNAKRRKLSHSPEPSEDSTVKRVAVGQQVKGDIVNSSTSTARKDGPQHGSNKLSQAATDDLLISQSSHKSSLLKLQLDELLSEVRPNFTKLTAKLEKPLFRLKEIIEAIPRGSAETLPEAEKRLKKAGVVIPFPAPRPAKDIKYKFEYVPPTDVNVVGGLGLKLGSKDSTALHTVDLAVTLSAEIFQDKDYLNHRYFHKRAYLVATFAAAIKSAAGDEFNITFEQQDDVQLQPCVVISPGKAATRDFVKSKCQIRIITAIPDTVFSLDKTNISKNCVRPKESDTNVTLDPTPFYNSCLRSEASVNSYLGLLSKALRSCEALRDACLLGSTWLQQRGYGPRVSSGGFGILEWALVSALLLEGGGPKNRPILSLRYNSYQLFKGVLQFLAGRDLLDPLIIGPQDIKIPHSTTPVLYDSRRGVNVLFKMTPWSYHLLRNDARTTVEATNETSRDSFESIFIAKLDTSVLRFDQIARVDLSSAETKSDRSTLYEKLYHVAVRGFGDRARLVGLQIPGTGSWAINKTGGKPSSEIAEIGLLLEPENVNRVVDRGPLAEEKEQAEDFRSFWGEKAELRRFKDGTISESLVWSETSSQSILHQILSVLVAHHFKLPPSVISMVGDQIERDIGIVPAQKTFQTMVETFQSFSSKLHALEGMPLNIRSLSATDEQLRFASLQDPITSSKPADIIVQFEGSSRWPDALTAIQRTKIAFLTRIGDLLESDSEPLSTRVGLENTHSNLLNNAFLDIFFPNGVVFRLRIHHEREQILLERQLLDKDLPGRTRDELASTLATYKRDYIHSPRHTQAIRALCTRYPGLSSTIRLFKKWISSHLLSSFFSAPLLELICARVYLHPQPWTTPSTPFAAFLRVLLLLSKWDWASDPLVIDFSEGEEMTASDLANINTNFQAWRKVDPAMNNIVLFVASNLDPSGVIWTQGSQPPKVVAVRLTTLARAAASSIRSKNAELDIPALFQSPLTHFDFLIHLKPSVVSRGQHKTSSNLLAGSSGTKFKNLDLDFLARLTGAGSSAADPDSTGYDPIDLYLTDLDHAFNRSLVLFFHDSDAGDVIAGLWNPRTVNDAPKEFRVRMGVSVKPASKLATTTDEEDDEDEDEDEDEDVAAARKGQALVQAQAQASTKGHLVEVNKAAMLAEMALLGQGIVERVQTLKE